MLPIVANPYQLTVMVNLCITLILTLSLNFVVGYSGQFHLVACAFFRVGAYASAIFAKQGPCVAVAVPVGAIFIVAVLAALIGLPVTRLKGLYLAVATLAFSLFIEVLVNQGGAVTGGGYGIRRYRRSRCLACGFPENRSICWRSSR